MFFYWVFFSSIVLSDNKIDFATTLLPFFSLSQTLTGTVKDSLGNPLQNANVIAKPLVEKQGLKFAIADHLGRYKLELEKEVPYEVRVSYLGFVEEI